MKGRKNIRHVIRMPRKAILLAAGYGTRMEPLSWDLPKPLMPLFGLPMLEHALLTLQAWGVEEVLINMHHVPHEILAWVRARTQHGPRIVLSYEADILGTGGALRKADHFIGSDPCWLVNTDIAFVLDPIPIVKRFYESGAPAVLWLDDQRGPRTVAANAEGIISDFAVPNPGVAGTYTYCGIQLFHPKLLTGLPDRAFCSVIDACRQMMGKGHRIYGCVVPDAYWADLGTPERYLQAHRDAPEPLRMRANVTARPASRKDLNAVLWDGAALAAGETAINSVIGRNVHLGVSVAEACVVRADVAGMPSRLTEVLRALRMSASETLYMQLPRRGSDRNFVRLVKGKRSAILVQYRSDRRPENARYAGHARFLASQGIPVPRVLHEEKDLLVLSDAGADALQDVPLTELDLWYPRVMRMIASLHTISLDDCPPLERGFDADLYAWEHDLFLEEYLARNYAVSYKTKDLFRQELSGLSVMLQRQPRVLVHRDLQSSNILLRGNKFVLIDFQGMRAGPAVYDLAALLYDPYVAISALQRKRYLDLYLEKVPRTQRDNIRAMLSVGGVQRLVQALGAFGRLSARADTVRFRKHIPAARLTLETLLRDAGLCPALCNWLKKHPVKEAA